MGSLQDDAERGWSRPRHRCGYCGRQVPTFEGVFYDHPGTVSRTGLPGPSEPWCSGSGTELPNQTSRVRPLLPDPSEHPATHMLGCELRRDDPKYDGWPDPMGGSSWSGSNPYDNPLHWGPESYHTVRVPRRAPDSPVKWFRWVERQLLSSTHGDAILAERLAIALLHAQPWYQEYLGKKTSDERNGGFGHV